MTPLVPGYAGLLERITLSNGAHATREQGMCVMEAIAYIAGRDHSDHPPCASRVITSFLVSWNDALPDNATRDRLLKPLVPLVVDTAGSPALELRRAYMCMDWLLRECAPTFLALTPDLVKHADALRGGAEVVDLKTIKQILPQAREAQKAAAAAWAAARAAAGAAARDAAWAAARDAARAAARDAARDAAWDAAWAAARAAAGDAAGDAARAALAPTVKALQKSALLLLDRMIEVGKEA